MILRAHVDVYGNIHVLYDDWIVTCNESYGGVYAAPADNLTDYDDIMNNNDYKDITRIYKTKWGQKKWGKELASYSSALLPSPTDYT